ncbi:MAG TPA: PadR family transcriptional regulator [Actinomycetes bacterium]|nr:PadR family transcriptional regulator [Actinomycetes bacterium]
MSSPPRLTTTSYSLLGLLAIQPWSAYDLAKQMDRSLSRFWPRARSKIYEEPRKLASLGLARSTTKRAGLRERTVYTITAKGRRTLAAWLERPSEPPAFESEHLLKVFFGEHGTTADIESTLGQLREWALDQRGQSIAVGREYLTRSGPYPERLPIHTLTGRFLTDYYELLADWSSWATTVVESWPDDPRDAEPDWALVEQVARRRPRT